MSTANPFLSSLNASLALTNAIQNNYIQDSLTSEDVTNIQTSINTAEQNTLQEDQTTITNLSNNQNPDSEQQAQFQAAVQKLSTDKSNFDNISQEAQTNQNIITDDCQRGAQNVQNCMQMISPILSTMSSFAQLLSQAA